jgi:hypothetical protein
MMRYHVPGLGLLIAALVANPLSAQITPPPGWGWHHDQRGASADSAGWRFDAMPPGFHLTTTTTGVTLFPAATKIEGRRAAEARVILFPGKGEGDYGLGVTDLADRSQWMGVLVRRDGSVAFAKVAAGRELIEGAWQVHEAIVKPDSTGYATNVLRVEVGTDEVAFLANGKRIGGVPRSVVPRSSEVAFRMGAPLNMHITIFDLITPMAPVPVKRTP